MSDEEEGSALENRPAEGNSPAIFSTGKIEKLRCMRSFIDEEALAWLGEQKQFKNKKRPR